MSYKSRIRRPEVRRDHPQFDLGMEILADIPQYPDYVMLADICYDFNLIDQRVVRAQLEQVITTMCKKLKIRMWTPIIESSKWKGGDIAGYTISIPAANWPAVQQMTDEYLTTVYPSSPDRPESTEVTQP